MADIERVSTSPTQYVSPTLASRITTRFDVLYVSTSSGSMSYRASTLLKPCGQIQSGHCTSSERGSERVEYNAQLSRGVVAKSQRKESKDESPKEARRTGEIQKVNIIREVLHGKMEF
jgi:hypothetical protein